MLRSSATLIGGAYQARKVGMERKAAAKDSLGMLKAEQVQPLGCSEAVLELGVRAAVVAKQCSVHGSTETQVRIIESMGQRVLRLQHITRPDGTVDPGYAIAWYASISVGTEAEGGERGLRTLSICFRGTRMESLTDWLANLDATPVVLWGDVNVHSGFYNTVRPWFGDIVALLAQCCAEDSGCQPDEIVLTGHSKGGSTALVLLYLLLVHRPAGVPLHRLRVVTFGSPLCAHSWSPPEVFLQRCNELLLSSGGAVVRNFIHECDVVPRSLGGQYHAELISKSSSAAERPQLRESRRYYPPICQPHCTYYYIHGGSNGVPLAIYEIPPPLLIDLLDLPLAFIDGFSAAKEAHRMTHYLTKLQSYFISK